jgi:hypothetical protein
MRLMSVQLFAMIRNFTSIVELREKQIGFV